MSIRRIDVCVAAFLVMLGLWIIIEALRYGIVGPNVAEPGFFPLLAGLLLTASASGALLKLLLEREAGERISGREIIPVLGSIAVIAVYLLLIETLGMVLLAPFFVFAIAWFIERPTSRRDLLSMAMVAIGFTAFAYVLFSYLLRVPLPRGIFGI